MRRGFSLVELMVTVAAVAVVTAVTLPRLGGVLDWLVVDAEAVKVTTALAVTRHVAIMRAARARLVVAGDSLRIDRWDDRAWIPLLRWVGPREAGVRLEVSNPEIAFGPTGIGWGASNTTVVLRRGSRFETITTSRLGRVKRW
jgi:prepilin-type N-terminal cleavage/methylation domain-containing protein